MLYMNVCDLNIIINWQSQNNNVFFLWEIQICISFVWK